MYHNLFSVLTPGYNHNMKCSEKEQEQRLSQGGLYMGKFKFRCALLAKISLYT